MSNNILIYLSSTQPYGAIMKLLLIFALSSALSLSACQDHGHLDCDDLVPINHVILPCPDPVIHVPIPIMRPQRPVIVIRPIHPPIMRPRPHYPRYRLRSHIHHGHHRIRSHIHTHRHRTRSHSRRCRR